MEDFFEIPTKKKGKAQQIGTEKVKDENGDEFAGQ